MRYAETTACALQRKGVHQQQDRVVVNLGTDWGSNPQPFTRVNEQ